MEERKEYENLRLEKEESRNKFRASIKLLRKLLAVMR